MYAHPMDTLTYRFAASFIVLSIPVALGWIKLSYRGKPIFKALLLALMYPLGFFTLQAFGLQHATSAEGGIMYAFTPVVTMIVASLFLKETTTLLQKLSIFLSVFGVVFIFIMKGSSFSLSNFLGALHALSDVCSFCRIQRLARSLWKHFSPTEISYLRYFRTVIIYLGVVASLISSLTANYAWSKIEASKMSVFTNLSTIVSIAAGVLFIGEEITVYHLIGSLLIIAGVIGTNYLGRKKTVPLRADTLKT
ncbi:drug/metabolite transporter (DMT)-like permease [Paenibacillus sp. RC21]